MTTTTLHTDMHHWRPIFWEPASGTGERLMVGVLYLFGGEHRATRIIRDDVLDSMYGQHHSAGAKNLIDTGLRMLCTVAQAAGLDALTTPVLGLTPGDLRCTGAKTPEVLLRTAALLYSSLSNIDRVDEMEVTDTPISEDFNRRFSAEVRDLVIQSRPDLAPGFGRSGALVAGGQDVCFGYFGSTVILHFSVLHPACQSACVRDARARLWELARAMEVSGIAKAALITAVPSPNDPTLGEKQLAEARANVREIECEAEAAHIHFNAAYTAQEGAVCVLDAIG